MKQILLYALLFLVWSCMNSCGDLSSQKEIDSEFEEIVFGVRLVEDSAMVEKYLNYHRNMWPEVEKSFKIAGYNNIRLYRYGNYITMIVKVPKGSDLGKMGQIGNDSHPRVGEWNSLMNNFQRGFPGVAAGQTWVEMDMFYEYSK